MQAQDCRKFIDTPAAVFPAVMNPTNHVAAESGSSSTTIRKGASGGFSVSRLIKENLEIGECGDNVLFVLVILTRPAYSYFLPVRA